MATSRAKPLFSSGIESLDEILQGILAGDNVVWQVDDIDHQIPFVHAFCYCAHLDGKNLVYFRFASHQPLVPDKFEPDVFVLDPRAGFEQFITRILNVISEYGRGTCYVFDCLSGLAADWYSDRMLGNFFKLACPYLYQAETVAYFSLLRNSHTPLSVQAIHRTAQVVLDLYYSNEKYYLLPLKVLERHTPTMYMLHSMDGMTMNPVTSSVIVSEILSSTPQPWIDGKIVLTDIWSKTLSEARACCEDEGRGRGAGRSREFLHKLIRMIVTRNAKVAKLCRHYFGLADLISIGKRMVGTGLIGGKATGMLLARAILEKTDPKWKKLLETHDSFFIGSDVFYSFIINNRCWWERHQMKSSPEPFKMAEKIRKRLLKGKFQRDTLDQFREILNYFGQSPIIVRSSSLLEDAYGNAFSGKYESVFLANQGPPEERLEKFKEAVRTVYASTMSPEVLSYRAHRGLWNRYEEMALLVQRVSGSFYGAIYLPHLAGVGYSFNPFVWNPGIDPHAGVLRLVFGLGTRAVDRHDDDYTRIVALNAPLKRPEVSADEVHKYSQHIIDIINIKENRPVSVDFEGVVKATPGLPLALFADRDLEMEERAEQYGVENVFSWILTFRKVLAETPLITDMRDLLATLDRAYEYPVDIEFAVNFIEKDQYRINLLQCRPFQVQMPLAVSRLPEDIRRQDILLQTAGPIIGEAATLKIDRIIFVKPRDYSALPTSERYSLARLIGDIANQGEGLTTMLIGPGRWGSKMPEMGVPVTFSDVRNVAVLCELAVMHARLTPDISLGTHFFNDIVEMGIVYMGIHPDREKDGYLFNEELLLQMPNTLSPVLQEQNPAAAAVHVVDMKSGQTEIFLHTNIMEQKGIVFRTRP
ncbi:MAG: PEP/pyruvate-binding domain-containing protein [Desulfobulbaceae bacterium]|nr:PEP/pyruvate-binding domain-containing protein [Desulfobulbaceae bacterium]